MQNRKIIVIGHAEEVREFLNFLSGKTITSESMAARHGSDTVEISDSNKHVYQFTHIDIHPIFTNKISEFTRGGKVCIILNQANLHPKRVEIALNEILIAGMPSTAIAYINTTNKNTRPAVFWKWIRSKINANIVAEQPNQTTMKDKTHPPLQSKKPLTAMLLATLGEFLEKKPKAATAANHPGDLA